LRSRSTAARYSAELAAALPSSAAVTNLRVQKDQIHDSE
jgi:hypothetical protein